MYQCRHIFFCNEAIGHSSIKLNYFEHKNEKQITTIIIALRF